MIKRKTPLKRSQKPLKRTPLKRTGKKRKKSQYAEDVKFYSKIWSFRPHICYETGIYLGVEPRSYMFHHVLEKEKYPEFRHEVWNIVLLGWDAHNQVHSNIDKTPKVKTLREKLLKQHVYGKDIHESRL